MHELDFIYLSQEDVVAIGLKMTEVITSVECVFVEHASRRVENPPKPGVHPLPNAFIHAMPAYLSGMRIAGLKWVSSFPSNAQRQLPAVMGLIVLNDVETGQPIALMDCRWITAIRTGAVSGVAAKYLARKDSSTIGIIGAGIQGRYNLLALKEVLPGIRRVKVFDINPEAVEAYITNLSKQVPFQIVAASSPQDAIEGADVIVTATGRIDKTVYFESWVKPGALVLPVHHRGWENSLLQKAEKFVCDDWPQLKNAHHEVGGFDGPLPALYAELGEIILGNKEGRSSDDERIIDFNYGLAMEDVAIGSAILEKARQQGMGQVLSLMKGDLPW